MLFSHKLVDALLALASEVAIGELVVVEVLVGTTVRSIKNGDGRRGRRPMWTSLGARPVAALTELL